MSTFRTRKSRGELTEDPYGDVFVVIDGWAAFRAEFEDYDMAVADIAARGLGFGVHLILTANRWAEIRPALKDLMGARLELRLGDPLDSEIDRKVAANVPASAPGRGITPDKLHLLIALPRIDQKHTSDDLVDGVAHTVAAIRGAWSGPHAPKVRMLPDKLDYAEIAAAADSDLQTPIGVDEQELAPVVLDFAAEPHLLVLGDSESGKTNLLRLICGGVLERRPSADDAVFLVVDYRRSLLGVVPQEQTLGYAAAANSLVPLVEEVEQALTARLPGPDVTAEQLRNHSWWSGPELFIVVDDYDLVSTQSGNPLMPLLELLPQARDIGLHLVIARRMGGASRALYEPLIQRLRELGAPGIMLSGDKEEGVLLGNLKPQLLPPGRGQLVSRRLGTTLVQTAWRPEDV
jgi:S-DNA-T family DNA segregation ATPase FtsK/SpoIIIE